MRGKALSVEGHGHSASNIISGTLPVARGGTGITSNPSCLVNLASASAASLFAASPRPGVTGTLPVTKGGTGATSAAAARSALGAAAASHTHDASNITSGTLPLTRGGTGVTTLNALKTLLGIDTSVQAITKIVTGSYTGNSNDIYGVSDAQTIMVSGINNIIAIIIFSDTRIAVSTQYASASEIFFGIGIKGIVEKGIIINNNMVTVSFRKDISENGLSYSQSVMLLNARDVKYGYIAFGN